MNTSIDFYFDFMSPFAYLARHRLAQCAGEYSCKINYRPVHLQRLKLAVGNDGPSNREMPIKLKYLVEDLKRWAAIYDVPFGFIGNVNTEKLNKGVFFAEQKGKAADYVKEAYRLTWGESGTPDDEGLLRGLAEILGWDGDEFMIFLDSAQANNAYEATNEEAIAKGVFGVPTMVIDDQMWWGNDRLFMVETYLRERFAPARASA